MKKIFKLIHNSKFLILNSYEGQALITLLFFIIMGVTITSAAAIVLVTQIQASSSLVNGGEAYYLAESGAEEGVLQVLRNPNYSGSETINLGLGVATVSATPGNPIVVLSTGKYGNFIRKIQVQTVYNNGILKISSWKEIL